MINPCGFSAAPQGLYRTYAIRTLYLSTTFFILAAKPLIFGSGTEHTPNRTPKANGAAKTNSSCSASQTACGLAAGMEMKKPAW